MLTKAKRQLLIFVGLRTPVVPASTAFLSVKVQRSGYHYLNGLNTLRMVAPVLQLANCRVGSKCYSDRFFKTPCRGGSQYRWS